MNKIPVSLRIAVIEDDAILREELSHFLRGNNHLVTELVTGFGLEELLREKNFDVIILDLNLPGLSGFEIAANIKKHHPEIGILMLTARTTLPDRIKSYNSGADIYLPKPTSPQEILAAVNSLGRRVIKAVSVDGWVLDIARHILSCNGNSKAVILTHIEEILLIGLSQSTNFTLDADTFCTFVSKKNYGHPMTRRALENSISRLRKKFSDCNEKESQPIIRSLRGVGYQLCIRITLQSET